MTEYTFHFIVLQEDDCFVAQALEVNLCFQAESREDLRYEVQRGIAAQVMASYQEGVTPFNLPPPPEEVKEGALEGPYKVQFTVTHNIVTFDDDSTWRTVQ